MLEDVGKGIERGVKELKVKCWYKEYLTANHIVFRKAMEFKEYMT